MIDYEPHEWWTHLFDIRGSMVRQIVVRVVSVTIWAMAVVWAHEAGLPIACPSTAHALVGVALGLLLVFRTNASYDRFWEGRKQWGSIVNETRNLARMARVWLEPEPAVAGETIRWVAAFPWSVMHSLRGERGLGPIAAALPREAVDATLAASHVPMAIAGRVTRLLDGAHRSGTLSPQHHVAIDQNVQLLVDCMGACERIHKTPLPFAYVVHLRRALILYCGTLPLALVRDFGSAAVLVTLAITYTFFGIEEIGVQIEDPFGVDDNDLPLEEICARLEANVLEIGSGLP